MLEWILKPIGWFLIWNWDALSPNYFVRNSTIQMYERKSYIQDKKSNFSLMDWKITTFLKHDTCAKCIWNVTLLCIKNYKDDECDNVWSFLLSKIAFYGFSKHFGVSRNQAIKKRSAFCTFLSRLFILCNRSSSLSFTLLGIHFTSLTRAQRALIGMLGSLTVSGRKV